MAKLLLNADGKVLMKDDKVYKAPEQFNILQWKCDTLKSLYMEFDASLFNSGIDTSDEMYDNILNNLDTSNVETFTYMFRNNRGITKVRKLNFQNAKRMDGMYAACKGLIGNIEVEAPNVTNINSLFMQCNNIETVTLKNMEKLIDVDYAFQRNINLKEVSGLKTDLCLSFASVFEGCKELETITTPLNFIKITSNIKFSGCSKIKNIQILNTKVNLTIGSGNGTGSSDYGHLLTLDSLINTIKELVNVGSSKTLTMGSANLEKIANVYVRRTTEGDIPTCLSDNSNIDLAKAPCEVCEATDEGAMLITAYANSKNWTLA